MRFTCKGLYRGIFVLFFVVIAGIMYNANTVSAKQYTVTPKSSPVISKYKYSKDYNTKTKAYLTLRSYLETLEKHGGGTLTIKKGKYKICSTLYIPSNVTIRLKKGAILIKTNDAGNSKVKVTKSLFECVTAKKAKKKNSVTGYKGSRNVQIIGENKSYIDLGGIKNAIGIGLSHNYNVSIEKIRFRNMNGGTYVAVGGSKKVTIGDCMFMNGKSTKGIDGKYAVRIESMQKRNDTFGFSWSKKDSTANINVKVLSSNFYNVDSGIGSSRSSTKYQSSIIIYGNKFKNLSNVSICAKKWKNVKVRKNTFMTTGKNKNTTRGFYGTNIFEGDCTLNTFTRVKYPIVFDNPDGKNVSTLSQTKIAAMRKNTVTQANKYYAYYIVKKKETRLAYFLDKVTNTFGLTTSSKPFQNQYTDNQYYNSGTKDYYVLRSYMEQLEVTGGGTVTITKGTYSLSNCIFIPSNVTVYFEDGSTVNKVKPTSSIYVEANEKARNGFMFMIVPPSKAVTSNSVGGYNGSNNVKMIGKGTAVIDLKSYTSATGIVSGHAKNVVIQGLTLLNIHNTGEKGKGCHFMEINSSQNVVIENCTFRGHIDNDEKNKEAINIDNPDANTSGFSQSWAIQDKTMCDNIIIKNSLFDNIERAIGSHMYSADDANNLLYHKRIQILNNTFQNSDTDQIYVVNWDRPVIRGNTFKNIASKTGDTNIKGIDFRSVIFPVIENNTFNNVPKAFQIYFSAKATDNIESAGYPISYTQLDIEKLKEMIKTNTFSNLAENYIRVYVTDSQQNFFNFTGELCDKQGNALS